MPMMANDNFHGALNNALYNIKSFAEVINKGYDLVTACPSCSLMIKRGYLSLRGVDIEAAKLVSDHLWYISDYLWPLIQEGKLTLSPERMRTDIFYHTPCHLKNQGKPEASLRLLKSIPGVFIKGVSLTCCGMGGTYGFKKEHYEVSKQIGNKVFDDIRHAQPARIVTDCGMCQAQIEDSTGFSVVHPMVLLREASMSPAHRT
jgi:Fe-S oxidoreductase